MDKDKTGALLGAIVVLGLVVAASAAATAKPSTGFKDTAAVLTFVAAGALVIERGLELFWTLVNELAGQWWPLKRLATQVKALEDDAANAVAPVFEQAAAAVSALEEDETKRAELVSKIGAEKDSVISGLAVLQKMAPTNQRTQLVATLAFQGVSFAQKTAERYSGDVALAASVAQQSITGAADFLATLKENPGRKMLSMYLGCVLGVVFSAFVGLDMFAAGLSQDTGAPGGTLAGVIMTGLVMGLGASPTHTIIGVLQEIQKARQLQTVALPEVSYGTTSGAVPRQRAMTRAEVLEFIQNERTGASGRTKAVSDTETLAFNSPAQPSPPNSLMLRKNDRWTRP